MKYKLLWLGERSENRYKRERKPSIFMSQFLCFAIILINNSV